MFYNILLDDDDRGEYETQSITIPLKEYENLVQKPNKLQNIINLMVKKIKLQDLQLKTLQEELQKPRIDVSKLSTVSYLQYLLTIFQINSTRHCTLTVFRNKKK